VNFELPVIIFSQAVHVCILIVLCPMRIV